MQIRAKREELLEALYWPQNTAERRNTMPMLANVLVETRGDRIRLTATDLEVGVRASLDGEILASGSVTVEARKLYEIVRELPVELVDLKRLDNDRVEVRSGKSVFRMVGLDAREFPAFAANGEVERQECPAAALKEMIEMTIFSISTDEARSNLNGALLHELDNNRVRMVTTDGHRLSLVQREIGPLRLEKGVIIPRKGLAELRRLLDDSGEGAVSLGFSGNMMFVWKGDVEMSIRLIDGEFPDYDKVIPAENENRAAVVQVALLRAVRRMALLSNERYRGVRVEFRSGTIGVSANNPYLGDAAEDVEADYQGSDIEIGYNPQYLLDVLNVMEDEDRIELGLTDDEGPTVVRRGGDDSLLYVVMPMRV